MCGGTLLCARAQIDAQAGGDLSLMERFEDDRCWQLGRAERVVTRDPVDACICTHTHHLLVEAHGM